MAVTQSVSPNLVIYSNLGLYHVLVIACIDQLSSSGSSLTSLLTPGQVYEKTREDPEIGSVMGSCAQAFLRYDQTTHLQVVRDKRSKPSEDKNLDDLANPESGPKSTRT